MDKALWDLETLEFDVSKANMFHYTCDQQLKEYATLYSEIGTGARIVIDGQNNRSRGPPRILSKREKSCSKKEC